MGKGIVKLGEGQWAVKDGNLLAAKETNGRFKNTEFTVSRGTRASYVGRDGLIKDASFYNLLPHSEDFTTWTVNAATTVYSNTTETLSPTNTYSASKITSDGSNGLYKAVAFSGGNNTKSVYLKGIIGGEQVILRDPAQTIEQKTLTLTTDWVRYELTENQTSTIGLWINEIPSNGIYMWGGQLVEGTEALEYQYTNGKEGIPRIDFTDNTDGHLLLEPQSTNLLTYSEDFSNSYWNPNDTNVESNFTTSPDGTTNASKITITDVTPYLGNLNISLIVGNTYTISCFVKKGTNRWLRLASVSSASTGAWFDLDNGVVGTVNSTSATIEDYGNGWYRITNTLTAVNGSNDVFLGLSGVDGSTSGADVIGNDVFVWGFQVEELSYPTSYIPTNGSTVTRDADTCTGAGSSADFNSEEGVLYAEISALENGGVNRYISLSDNTTNNRLNIIFSSNTDRLTISGAGNIGSFTNVNFFSYTQNIYNKIAIKYSSSGVKLFVNGSLEGSNSDNVSWTSNTLTTLDFSLWNQSTAPFEGKVKAIRVYKEALSDTDLQNLTS